MDINLNGKLYVHFIKGIFENNNKIGSEIIINTSKSDFMLIDGLKRLKILNNNKIILLNDNILCGLNTYITKYIGEFDFIFKSNILQLTKYTVIEKDESINKSNNIKLNSKIFINNYSTKKYNVVNDIVNIIQK